MERFYKSYFLFLIPYMNGFLWYSVTIRMQYYQIFMYLGP